MPAYSHSSIETYTDCPRRYKFRYIERLELPEEVVGVEAFLGSTVHSVLEKLYKDLLLSRTNSLDELLAFYNAEWERNWHEGIMIVKEGFTAEHYRETGARAVSDYYRRYHPFDSTRTLSTEMRVVFQIGDYTIKGFIDRLSEASPGVYEIHDYKTSGRLPTQDLLDRDRQLALYDIGLRQKFRDIREVRLVWHYLIFDKEFTSVRTEEDLEGLKSDVVGKIQTIEGDKKFIPKESALCDWCEYYDHCPAKRHGESLKGLPLNKYLESRGVSLVNRYAEIKNWIRTLKEKERVLQAELSEVEEAAVKFAKDEGITNITGSGFFLRLTETEDIIFPKVGDEGREELEGVIKREGAWEEFSTLNIKRLSSMARDGELEKGLEKKVMKFAEVESHAGVRLLKKKEEGEK